MTRFPRLLVLLLFAALATFAVASAQGAKAPSPPGKGPKLTVTPASATLGPVAPGVGAWQEFVLGFKDGKTSGELTVAVAGDGFAVTDDACTGTALKPGQTCSITVMYVPGDYGESVEGTLTATGKPDVKPAAALLFASSEAAALVSADPVEIGFGERETVGGMPTWITFTNNATVAVKLVGIDWPVGFAAGSSVWQTCDQDFIAPGATCEGSVAFTAAAPGEDPAPGYYEGQLITTWQDSAGNTVSTTKIYLDGTLLEPSVPENQAPTAYGQSNVLVVEDTATTITLSGGDPDGDALSFSIWADESAEHGSLGAVGTPSCSGTPSVCTADVVYTPNSGYTGSDRVGFWVSDGVLSNWNAWVTIIVTPADGISPWANTLSWSYVPDESVTITLSGGDPNGDALTFEIYEGPSHGTLSEIGTPSCTSEIPSICEADVTYTPGAGLSDPDSFSYRTVDGEGHYSNVVTVTVQLS